MKKVIFSLLILILGALQLNATIKSINNFELNRYMKKRIVIVDIREKFAWDESGIIPSSYRITYKNSQEIESWLRVFTRIVKNKNMAFILVSQKGRKAYKLSKILDKKIGYQNIYYLKGGIEMWMNEDGRVVKY